MHNLLKPKWLLLTTLLPLGLLMLLCWGEFEVLKTLLPPASVELWRQLALVLAGLLLGTLSYAGWAGRRGQPVSAWYAGAALLAYGAFLVACTGSDSTLVPLEIPRWLVPTDILLAIWTFIMPTLAYSLLVLVVHATPTDRPQSASLNFGMAVAVPAVALVLCLTLNGVLRSNYDWAFWRKMEQVLWPLIVSIAPLTFLFFLVRGAYIMSLRRANDELSIVWKVLITLVLPLVGLAVNAGLWLQQFGEANIFGDFNRPWFYGLAALNGVLLCWPTPAARRGRLALLLGRSALLGYTGYFFVVFLPFLPLSVVAVIAIGTGFLMLTPLVLLVVHLHALADDVAALQAQYPRWVPRAGLLGGVAVLPLLLTADYYHDRRVLHAALAYAYSPNYTRSYDLDAAALARTLAVVRQHKDRSNRFLTNLQQPYLSTYYNWLVLDNLMLSDDKLTTLERIFVSSPAAPAGVGDAGFGHPPATTALRQLTARSTYDARQQAWISWVDLAVANADTTQRAAEYTTTFALPPGCWVGDYYLNINGHREPGILAEKKAADWVYAQIIHQTDRRDPGLLTYVGPDQLRLNVYPVVLAAARRTGFQVLHKEPVTLTIDGRTLALGTPGQAPPLAGPVAPPGGGVVYLSAAAQQRLPLVRRRPYYHFLLDVSAAKAAQKTAYKKRAATFLRQHAALGPPRFTLVNTYATPVPAGADWQAALDAFPNAGGCYLTGAVRRVLAEAWQHPAPTYPVLVAVTDTLAATVLAPDFAAFAPAYPESDDWLVLGADGRAGRHSLRHDASQALPPATPLNPAVRAWPSAAHARAYLPATGQAAVVLREPAAALAPPSTTESRWLAGLLLRGYDHWQTLHPAAADNQYLAFIRASFEQRILTPLTAFLALENASQKAALRRKQAQTLAANANLDTQETPNSVTAVPLDDYAPWLLLLGVGLGWRRLRARQVA